MIRKIARITIQFFCALLFLVSVFVTLAISFWGTDLTSLKNYPAQNYPKYVYDALIAAEDPNFLDSFTQRNACIVTEERCGGSLRQWTLKRLTAVERPDLRSISLSLHYTIALPRANITVAPNQFLDYILDTSYFGMGITGLKAAAHVHFETTSDALTLAQAAQLTALFRHPTGLSRDPERWANRARFVLKTMLTKNLITKAQHDAALSEL